MAEKYEIQTENSYAYALPNEKKNLFENFK
jgi:hypothetical protein